MFVYLFLSFSLILSLFLSVFLSLSLSLSLSLFLSFFLSFFLPLFFFQAAVGALDNLTNDVCEFKVVNNVGQKINAVNFTWRWWDLLCLCRKFRRALILEFQNLYIIYIVMLGM